MGDIWFCFVVVGKDDWFILFCDYEELCNDFVVEFEICLGVYDFMLDIYWEEIVWVILDWFGK